MRPGKLKQVLSDGGTVAPDVAVFSRTKQLMPYPEHSFRVMNPELEYLPKERERSFNVRYIDEEYYQPSWHYHPEYELVLNVDGWGKRFICDKINDLKPGDVVLIGPLMPHAYRNDPQYHFSGSALRAKAIVVHFSADTFGENLFTVPETSALQCLFDRSARGLNILGDTRELVSNMLFELLELKGFIRWLKLLEILNIIAESPDYEFISNSIVTGKNKFESGRLNKVVDFVMKNFSEDIYVSDAAGLINMAENSFSRYFSERTGKTFASFVTEIRLGYACKLLTDNALNISEISYRCGFNNLSNFNRHFSKMYCINPFTYRKQYLNKL